MGYSQQNQKVYSRKRGEGWKGRGNRGRKRGGNETGKEEEEERK